MSKNLLTEPGRPPRIVRAFFHLTLCLALTAAAAGPMAAQGNNPPQITIDVAGQPLARVIESLRTQSGYEFVFNSVDVNSAPNVTLRLNSVSLQAVLNALLADGDLAWTIEDRTVIIRKNTARTAQSQDGRLMTGTVRDAAGRPMPGVNVMVKGTTRGASTDTGGHFSIATLGTQEHILVFSFLGMTTREIAWRGQPLDVTMEEQSERVDEVVVTGIFERRSESFTGSLQTFTQDELRKVGSSNIIQSLKNLDPSFSVIESLAEGSNPNFQPEIRLRGQSGFPDLRGEYSTNPNQPLFILDGFETTLTKVMDMEMSRIASVTILKDAAATAIYGSKAGNGVVVIETHHPEAGELRLTYTGYLNVQAPDLTSYDLTNAAEKLQVEKAGGRYISAAHDPVNQLKYDLNYNELLEEVLRGVDTYWLSKPVSTGIGHKHVLYLDGGTDRFTYGLDFSYNNVTGVMKGSNRNTISGGVTLGYRYRNLLLRNSLDVMYNKGTNSPYGSFSKYADMNPYYRATDEEGNILKIVGDGAATGIVANPLWDSTLNSVDFDEYSQFTDNLLVEWRTALGLKVTARGSVTRTDRGSELFHPASHTDFVEYNTPELVNRRGRYTYGDGMDFSFSADVNANYSRFFGKHYVFGNIGWRMTEGQNRFTNFVAEGFPSDYLQDITFARQYLKDGNPTGTENTTRNVNVIGAVNYSYADRYLFDFSMNMSGSSQFGRNNPWGTFWSLGAGWNLHNETFMQDVRFLDRLRLRASIGYTGSENFNSYQALSTYSFTALATKSYLGQYGAYLLGISNPDLHWQRVYKKNIGIDAEFLEGRLTARFEYYANNTDGQLTDVSIGPSTGFTSYKANIGEIHNRGVEGRVGYRLWNDRARGNFVNVYVSAAHNVNKIHKISDALAAYNDLQTNTVNNRPVVLYIEGESLNTIWAVPSYGIDPASGRDILVRPDGTVTFDWDADYLVPCGDTEPKVSGNGGFNIDFEGFSLNVAMTWRLGGQIYNQTVVNRVENADITKNVDRRVFSDRWYSQGDVSWFKNIASRGTTQATQRFVEDLNEWTLSAVNLSYDIDRAVDVKKLGMSRLQLSFDMSDVARLSSVRVERGTSYPFARTFSFSLKANF